MKQIAREFTVTAGDLKPETPITFRLAVDIPSHSQKIDILDTRAELISELNGDMIDALTQEKQRQAYGAMEGMVEQYYLDMADAQAEQRAEVEAGR